MHASCCMPKPMLQLICWLSLALQQGPCNWEGMIIQLSDICFLLQPCARMSLQSAMEATVSLNAPLMILFQSHSLAVLAHEICRPSMTLLACLESTHFIATQESGLMPS